MVSSTTLKLQQLHQLNGKKALTTACVAFAGWMKESRALPLKGTKSGYVQDDVHVSGAEKITGENTCLGSGLGSVEQFGSCGVQAVLTHLSIQSTQNLRDRTGWELEKVML